MARNLNAVIRSFSSLALLTVVLLAVWCLPAHAGSALAREFRPIKGEPLQLRTLENPPLAFTDENGDVTGILVESIREAVARTGHEVEFKIYPWKRVLQQVSEGHADAAFNAGKNEERQAWGRYHDSVLIDETYVFFSSEPLALSREINEAPNLRVGIQLGYYYGERFDQMLQDPPFESLEVSQTIPRNLKLLRAGRTHVFIGDLLPTMHYIKEMGLQNDIHIVRDKDSGHPLVVSRSPTYVAFSKLRVDPEYVNTFNEALKAIKADETFDTILDNYDLNVPDIPDVP